MIVAMISGCQTQSNSNTESLSLVSPLTAQEVLDYYAKALDYDTVIRRNYHPYINNYETTDVTDEKTVNIILNELNNVEYELSQDYYRPDKAGDNYLSESLYNYIKATLNNKSLNRSSDANVKIKQALGYYFVDVDYEIGNAKMLELNNRKNLIGINGAFHYSPALDTDSVDTLYMRHVVIELNNYFSANSIDKVAIINDDATNFELLIVDSDAAGNVDFSDTTLESENSLDATLTDPLTENTESIENIDSIDNTIDNTVPDISETQNNTIETVVKNNEQNKTDDKTDDYKLSVDLVHKLAGYGNQIAYIPKLSYITNIKTLENDTELNGYYDTEARVLDGKLVDYKEYYREYNDYKKSKNITINGIGLYDSGNLGLQNFGISGKDATGTCTLRFVFKSDLVDPDILLCENIYVLNYSVNPGLSVNNDSKVPDFLMTEFSTVIDRVDRLISNNDISGFAAGHVFDDVSMAVLAGFKENYSNTLRHISVIRNVISRDIKDKAYLLEVESFIQDGAESVDKYASYKDTSYVVIEQRESEFVVSDWMLINRELVVEPDINPYAASLRRIISIGLTDAVTDSDKENVNELMKALYLASTYRVLTVADEPMEMADGTVIKRGMYDCFNSNIELLSSTEREKYNADLRALLIKYGTTTSAEMTGTVTEWIGSGSGHVEFITEELITYQGRNVGTYINCYYLVSCVEDVWVIDDMQVIVQEEISGEQLNAVKNRLS